MLLPFLFSISINMDTLPYTRSFEMKYGMECAFSSDNIVDMGFFYSPYMTYSIYDDAKVFPYDNYSIYFGGHLGISSADGGIKLSIQKRFNEKWDENLYSNDLYFGFGDRWLNFLYNKKGNYWSVNYGFSWKIFFISPSIKFFRTNTIYALDFGIYGL